MARVILLSQYPLPYHKIGSWTNMYKSYLEGDHKIDFLICEAPAQRFENVQYVIVRNGILQRLRRKVTKMFRIGFIDALERFLETHPDEKFVLQSVDNYKLIYLIDDMLRRRGFRKNIYIQVFFHGFAPFIKEEQYPGFYARIDELVLLTVSGYRAHQAFYSTFPCKVSIRNNGVDVSMFRKPSPDEKREIQQKLGIAGKKVFLWCSQDRPKKGLSLLLEAWRKIYSEAQNIVLLVVGAEREHIPPGVRCFGRVDHSELPQYYQASDCYLFPTLCHEGFGLSLIEALNCGCHCIASNVGGVPEVLQYGKLGKLVDDPNFVSQWSDAISAYLSGTEKEIILGEPVYTMQEWTAGMNALIAGAKECL